MRLSAIIILISLFSNWSWSAENIKKVSYKEKIDIHIGRNSFVAGELLFYKAYCYSNQESPDEFLSKAVYVELIDEKRQRVVNQVVEVVNNCASSMIQIPDTIATGLYYFRAYTQWMRNFGNSSYFSEPVFIYNQYDENSDYALTNYTLPLNPLIYLESDRLIAGIANRIIINIPGLSGNQISGSIINVIGDTLVQNFTTDQNGLAIVSFIPSVDMKYNLIIKDSYSDSKSFTLPTAEYSGYILRSGTFDVNSIRLSIEKINLPSEPVRLIAISGGIKIAETNFIMDSQLKEVLLAIPKLGSPFIQVQLLQSDGELLAKRVFMKNGTQPLSIQSLQSEYIPRDKVSIQLILDKLSENNLSDISVSVYKKQKSDSISLSASELSAVGDFAFLYSQNTSSVFQKYSEQAYKIANRTAPGPSGLWPVEDLGILMTGKVINLIDKTPARNVQVDLAINDTLARIYAAQTDSFGRFVLLLDERGNKSGFIDLKLDGLSVNDKYIVEFDDKFDRSFKGHDQSTNLSRDQLFITFMKDEAQRTLIQRAFNNIGSVQTVKIKMDQYNSLPFYGKPLLTVFPEDYIVLPNFEEIARELIPRVKYKQAKSGCEINIIDIENNIKSEDPVVLIDGVPVINLCELYPLSSDDIQRIEIQSGNHISGNYLYNGLLAVYTTDKYKLKKHSADERMNYFIPGYSNNTTTYSINNGEGFTANSKMPDFRNQLYWNPDIQIDGGQASLDFYTSDEEGEYILDIKGYTMDGYPVHLLETFTIAD